MKNALNFTRTLGLYADNVILADTFTPRLVFQSRFSQDDYFNFISDTVVLWTLSPLVRAGILRFRLPVATLCEQHHAEFEN